MVNVIEADKEMEKVSSQYLPDPFLTTENLAYVETMRTNTATLANGTLKDPMRLVMNKQQAWNDAKHGFEDILENGKPAMQQDWYIDIVCTFSKKVSVMAGRRTDRRTIDIKKGEEQVFTLHVKHNNYELRKYFKALGADSMKWNGAEVKLTTGKRGSGLVIVPVMSNSQISDIKKEQKL